MECWIDKPVELCLPQVCVEERDDTTYTIYGQNWLENRSGVVRFSGLLEATFREHVCFPLVAI